MFFYSRNMQFNLLSLLFLGWILNSEKKIQLKFLLTLQFDSAHDE